MPDTSLQRKIAERHAAAQLQAIVIPVASVAERMGLKLVTKDKTDGVILKALPGDYTLITITGTFVDLAGVPIVGTISFTPSYTSVLDDLANMVGIVPITLTATLSGGAISIQLPATDDPDVVPQGWSYLVKYNFAGFSQSFSIVVPYNGGPIDLSTVNPVSPVVGLDAFVTFGELENAVDAAIDSVLVISATPPSDTTAIWIDTTT